MNDVKIYLTSHWGDRRVASGEENSVCFVRGVEVNGTEIRVDSPYDHTYPYRVLQAWLVIDGFLELVFEGYTPDVRELFSPDQMNAGATDTKLAISVRTLEILEWSEEA